MKFLLGRLGLRDSGSLKLIGRLFADNFWNHWRRYLLSFVLMGVAAATTAYSAVIIKYVVDEIFIAHNLPMLVPLSLAIMGLSLGKGFANYFQEVVLGRLGNRIVAENQRRVYDHLLKFGVSHFTTQPSSSLIMVVNGGATAFCREQLGIWPVCGAGRHAERHTRVEKRHMETEKRLTGVMRIQQ